MGLFGLFKKKVSKKVIKFEEVVNWLDKYVERQELGTTLGIIKREIKAKLIKLEELLNELENATVKDPTVFPERALNIMEGNKKSYIIKVRNAINEIKYPEKYDDFKPFLEELSKKITSLASETQKNYFVLKEFMEHEVRKTANKLSELDKLVSQGVEQLEHSSLDLVDEIKKLISDYHLEEKEILQMKNEIKKIQENKKTLLDKKQKIEEKIQKLRDGKGYEEYVKLNEKEKKLKLKLKESENKILRIFYDSEAAIKKYHNKVKDSLLKEYMEDSLDAFLKDKDFQIIKHLKKIYNDLDSLELKDSKLKKIKPVLEKIDEKLFENLKEAVVEVKQEHDNILRRIKNHVVHLNIKEQEGWVESLEKDVEVEENNLLEIENKLERLNPSLIKQKIKEKIKLLDSEMEFEK